MTLHPKPATPSVTLEAPAAAGPEDEDEEEALPHSEAMDVFQEGLAMVVQDPLLCDLPIQVRPGGSDGPGRQSESCRDPRVSLAASGD